MILCNISKIFMSYVFYYFFHFIFFIHFIYRPFLTMKVTSDTFLLLFLAFNISPRVISFLQSKKIYIKKGKIQHLKKVTEEAQKITVE